MSPQIGKAMDSNHGGTEGEAGGIRPQLCSNKVK